MGDGEVSKKIKKNPPIWRGEASPFKKMESSNILTRDIPTLKTSTPTALSTNLSHDICEPSSTSQYRIVGANGNNNLNDNKLNRKRKNPGNRLNNSNRAGVPIPIPGTRPNPPKRTPIPIPTQGGSMNEEKFLDMLVQNERKILDEAFHELYGEQKSLNLKNIPTRTNNNVTNKGTKIPNVTPNTIDKFKNNSDITLKSKFYIEELAWKLNNPPTPHCCGPYTLKQTYDQEVYNKKIVTPKKEEKSKSINTLPSSPSSPISHVSNGKKSNRHKKDPIHSIKPLSPSTPLPAKSKYPNTPFCQWSFDSSTRVLHADFTPRYDGQHVTITPCDKDFLYLMMERDDITVVSSGLCQNMNPQLWNKTYLSSCVGNDVYYRFRSFQRVLKNKNKLMNRPGSQNGTTTIKKKVKEKSEIKKKQSVNDIMEHGINISYEENDLWFKIRMKDYFRYLSQREQALENIVKRRIEAGLDPVNPRNEDEDKLYRREEEEIFNYEDITKNENDQERNISINCIEKVLYMIDYDLGKYLPKVKEDFVENFPLKGILPGGNKCMMNAVNLEARPFMGPNLYLTPPASFTQFHQDGHGTVDSGHICLSGYNEVVMLRRLTEGHKRHALFLLKGGKSKKASNFKWNSYDALYGRPHDDGYVDRPDWPTVQSIKKCKHMNYYPSVFILKPGQLVHINKGRLHAFRKLSPTTLPKSDCHHNLRSKIMISENLGYKEHICMSVAWDWMYKGITDYGINKELSSILECAHLNRQQLKQSLAIPEICIIKMAKELVAQYEYLTDRSKEEIQNESLISFKIKQSKFLSNSQLYQETMTGLHGILASLQYIISCHQSVLSSKKNQAQNLTIASIPNTWENPELSPLDPYGSSDFFCKLCYKELSNVYLHCDGCEDLLKKDFNICESCHSEHRYHLYFQMHTMDDSDNCAINHTGHHHGLSPAIKCACKKKTICSRCQYCSGCSCKCHQSFTLHHRFMSVSEEKEILEKVKKIVGSPGWRIEVTNERLNSLHNREIEDTDSKSIKTKKNENSKLMKNDTNKSKKLVAIVKLGKHSSEPNDETNNMSVNFNTKEMESPNPFQSTNEKITSSYETDIILDSSFYDMLEKSKPFDSKLVMKRKSIIEGCNMEELRLKFKRFLDATLIRSSDFNDVIPEGFDKVKVLHLYRNFIDTRELLDLKRTKFVNYSPRELEILIDYVSKTGKVDSTMHFELIPYRAKKTLQMVTKDLLKLEIIKNKDLIQHVDTVVKCITEWNKQVTPTINNKSKSEKINKAINRSIEKVNIEEEERNVSIITQKSFECKDKKSIDKESSAKTSMEDSNTNICNRIKESKDRQSQITNIVKGMKDTVKYADPRLITSKLLYPNLIEEQKGNITCQPSYTNGSNSTKPSNLDTIEMELSSNDDEWYNRDIPFKVIYSSIDLFDQGTFDMFSHTKPKCNSAFQCTQKIVSNVKNLSIDDLKMFVRNSESISQLSIKHLSKLIPSFERDHIFHLYRNFHDENHISGNYLGAIHFCRREVEILSYVLAINGDLRRFQYLIPYRTMRTLEETLQHIENEKLLDNIMYKTNISNSMTALFKWEKENLMDIT